MKFFVSTLMIFAIFTLSLACSMAFCPMQSAQASEPVPCHEKSADTEDGGIMLVSDCMGVDFFFNDTSQDIQIDQSVDTLDFARADLSVSYSFEPQNINGIRGPPPQDVATSPSRPLYLTTQRFRI